MSSSPSSSSSMRHHASSAGELASAGRLTATPLAVVVSPPSRLFFRASSGYSSRWFCWFRAPARPESGPYGYPVSAEAPANAAASAAASTAIDVAGGGAVGGTARFGSPADSVPGTAPELRRASPGSLGSFTSRSDRRMASSRSAAASRSVSRGSVGSFASPDVRLRLCSVAREAGDVRSLPAREGLGSPEPPAASAPSPEPAPRCCAFACCSDIASAWRACEAMLVRRAIDRALGRKEKTARSRGARTARARAFREARARETRETRAGRTICSSSSSSSSAIVTMCGQSDRQI